MCSKTVVKKTTFFLFVACCILDPSNKILGLKEVTFLLFLISHIKDYLKSFNAVLFLYSIFFALIFPSFYLFIGMAIDNHFSKEVALSTFRAFPLIIMLNFLLNKDIQYEHIFSRITIILVPTTLIIFFLVFTGNSEIVNNYLGGFKTTVMLARRDFGDTTFLMIYFKTISLLLFGLSYELSKQKNLRISLLSIFILTALILSASRAVLISAFLITFFHLYRMWFSKSTTKKYLFYIFNILVLFPTLIPIARDFFDPNEPSNAIKYGFFIDYLNIWKTDPISFFTGNGLGSGIYTSQRGISYNLETTYLEIIRVFGIFGGLILFITLIFPIAYYFNLNQKKNISTKSKYFLLSYFCYVFFIIPSNPLLFSSTGILAICLTYSLIFKIKRYNFY